MFGSRTVRCRATSCAQAIGDLQQEGALTDPGVPANQHQRSRNNAATEDAIKFSDYGRDADFVLRFDFRIGDGLNIAEFESTPRTFFFRRALLNQRIPLAALRTLSQPLARLMSTVLTGEDCFSFFQWFDV